MARRAYEGDPLDGTAQYITERPELEEEADEVAYATDAEATTEAVLPTKSTVVSTVHSATS
jgi:hypothetical protein